MNPFRLSDDYYSVTSNPFERPSRISMFLFRYIRPITSRILWLWLKVTDPKKYQERKDSITYAYRLLNGRERGIGLVKMKLFPEDPEQYAHLDLLSMTGPQDIAFGLNNIVSRDQYLAYRVVFVNWDVVNKHNLFGRHNIEYTMPLYLYQVMESQELRDKSIYKDPDSIYWADLIIVLSADENVENDYYMSIDGKLEKLN